MSRRTEGKTSSPAGPAGAARAAAAAVVSAMALSAAADPPGPESWLTIETTAQLNAELAAKAAAAKAPPAPTATAGQHTTAPTFEPLAARAPLTPDAEDTRAATALLREAVHVRPGGRHHRLLRALRFMEDPGLEPFFARLRGDKHPALRVHGLLGTAELARPRGITLENLIQLEHADQRAEVISAALDGGLLSDRTLDELLAWPDLADGVKLLLATPRVAAGRVTQGSPAHAAMVAELAGPDGVGDLDGVGVLDAVADLAHARDVDAARQANAADAVVDRAVSDGAAESRALQQRGLAALLLHQMGDRRGTRGLIAINNVRHPARDRVRAHLLETAQTHGLHRAGTWAYSVASEPDLPPRLGELALQVAAEFGDTRAHQRWGERVRAAKDRLPRRIRLSLAGLAFASAAKPEVFNWIAVDGDPFVAATGRAARAVAAARQSVAPDQPPVPASNPAVLLAALDDLHATQHPMAHAWLAGFAAAPTTPDPVAAATARRLVTGYQPGRATGRTRRLEAVLDAVETLLQRDPAAAADELPRVLADADPACTQAVLLGLIRSRTPTAAGIARALTLPDDPDARALALVLRLRSGGPVGPALRTTLTRVLQGRTQLDDELRMQAAWSYLKRTAAINAVAAPADGFADVGSFRSPLFTPKSAPEIARTRSTP